MNLIHPKHVAHICGAAMASVWLLACSSARTIGFSDASREAPTRVTVVNNNWLDVTVYAVRGATRVRLAMVPGTSRATLWLPPGISPDGTVRLMADPIGSPRTYLTDVISFGPGQRVEFRVGSVLRMSGFAVWNR